MAATLIISRVDLDQNLLGFIDVGRTGEKVERGGEEKEIGMSNQAFRKNVCLLIGINKVVEAPIVASINPLFLAYRKVKGNFLRDAVMAREHPEVSRQSFIHQPAQKYFNPFLQSVELC